VVAFATIPDLRIIPDIAIGSRGPVRSILLVSKVPIKQIRTVAADAGSRTSVALARVLLRKWFGGGRLFTSMEPKLSIMLHHCDAALIIGDPALTLDRSRYLCYDLAQEWNRLTGKPFVFAFWAVRGAALGDVPAGMDLVRIFQQSRDRGLENIDSLAREWAPRVGLTPAEVRTYLTQNIDYTLGVEQIEGLELFFRYAVEQGVLAAAKPLEFLPSVTTRSVQTPA
jgi:chorismate dehydratase